MSYRAKKSEKVGDEVGSLKWKYGGLGIWTPGRKEIEERLKMS